MRIKRLSIRNFRSIQSLDVDLPMVCALVGPNNAGKSNLLGAVRRVLGGGWVRVSDFGPDDIYLRDTERDIEITCTLDPPLQYVKFKNAPPTDVHALSFQYTRYKVGENKGQPRLEQKCMDAKGAAPMVLAKAPKRGEPHHYAPLVGLPSEVRDQVPLIHIGTNRSLREQLPGARYSMLRQMFQAIDAGFHDTAQTVKVRRADGSEITMPRHERFRDLMKRAMDLLRTDEFDAVERSIKRNALRQLGLDPAADADKLDLFFTPMDTFSFYKSLDLVVKEGDFAISAQEMGEGMQNAIVLAILQAFEETRRKGAILLIEEPEMFLHPQMQRSLYKTIREIGRTNQVIYTTHSPHFVSVPEYDEVLLVRKLADGTAARPSTLPTNDRRREKMVKELDPERNELFFARRLLLVEGDTEKLAFPVYAGRLGLDLDREGATIVEVGGKRNLMEFAQIAASFEIPTGVVYDEDSSDFGPKQKEDETRYNAALDDLAKADGSVRVWRFSADYEAHLRKALSEDTYQRLCQRFPNTGKPTRARLIAMENGTAIPPPVDDILHWLADRPKLQSG
jgi:ABC-type cobalamin/Fe3+-siderophores transport system ATPase subunit